MIISKMLFLLNIFSVTKYCYKEWKPKAASQRAEALWVLELVFAVHPQLQKVSKQIAEWLCPPDEMGSVETSSLMRDLLKQAGGVAVVDGGLATELERHGADLNDPLWSAKCILTSPHLIRTVPSSLSLL